MKLITKNTDYAVRSLIYLARSGQRLVPSREIAGEENIPLPFLRRILRQLVGAGLISSREGAAGGVQLTADPDRIELIELIRIFQGEISLTDCLFQRKLCPNRSRCVLRARLKKIEALVFSELAGVTVGGLVRDIEEKTDEKKDH